MTILHAIPYMDKYSGGPPIVAGAWTLHAQKAGFDARIAVAATHCCPLADEIKDVQSMMLPITVQGPLRIPDKHRLSLVLKGVDLVHLHTLWSPFIWRIAKACWNNKIPYVVSPHGMLDPHSLSVRRLKKRAAWMLIEKQIIEKARCVVVTTAEEEALAKAAWLDIRKKCSVVPLGVFSPESTSTEAFKRHRVAKIFEREKSITLVFLGRIHPKKGIERLIQSVSILEARNRDCRLIICGTGEPSYEKRLRSQVEKLGLDDCVFFVGHLDGDVKWDVLKKSDAFLLPSFQENFGIAVAEAMSMGTPPIVSSAVNLSSDIRDSGAGIVLENTSPTHIADSVEIIIRQRNQYSARSMSVAEAKYSWVNSYKALQSLYDSFFDAPLHSE